MALVLNIFQKKSRDSLATDDKYFRMQAYVSIMCRYFYTGFIDFMLKGKSSTYFTNLFSPHIISKRMIKRF